MTRRGVPLPSPRATLRGRMLIALVATSVVTLAAAGVVAVVPLERRVEHDRVDALRELARAMRPALRAVPVADRRPGSPAVVGLAALLQRRAGGHIVVYDAAGRRLADAGADVGAVLPAARDLVRALALGRGAGVVTGDRADVAFAATAAGATRDRLTMVIAERLDDSRAAVAVMRSALPLALLAGLAAALGLSLLLSRSLLRRLRRLEADARALATDGLTHRVAVTGSDEVSIAARALEEMRVALVDEQASRQAFLSTASHELRTPLASLQATLELLEEELRSLAGDEAGAGARVDTALRQTRRLVTLATDLLDLSRVDGAAPLALEPIELGDLARTIGPEFAPRLRADGRELALPGEPALALADPAAVARILRVLLDNAANYGCGTVTVELVADDRGARLAVQDEGPGLSGEEAALVFRRFARGRAAAGTPGAGLGLAIARGLARSMGGELVAEPVARGARFVLTLGRAPAADEPADRDRDRVLRA
jgi:signal transduction histidine kinase